MGDDKELTLVWAKMKGFCPWPGYIADPPADVLKKRPKSNKNAKCVFFFGSRNFAWVEDKDIHNYVENRERLLKTAKGAGIKEAIKQIDQYISDPVTYKSNCELIAPVFNTVKAETDKFDKLRQNNEVANGDSADDTLVDEALSVRSAPTTVRKSAKKNSVAQKANSSFNIKLATPSKRSQKSIKVENNAPKSPASKRRRLQSPEPTTFSLVHKITEIPKYSSSRSKVLGHLLNRPDLEHQVDAVEPNTVDMADVSSAMRNKNINPSSLNFGFLGLGIMGSGIVKNLVNSGHKVVVWNRTRDKCLPFEKAGAHVAPTPSDVVDKVDITFSCVSDPVVAKEMVFGNCGILQSEGIGDGKGYVEMTGMDDGTSIDIAEAIHSRGGRYLEAMLQGSKTEADDGTLIVVAAGEKSLFDECQTCFEAMGKNSFYLGDVGFATKMYMSLQTISGNIVAALAEGMALAERSGLELKDLLEVLELTTMASPMLIAKGRSIVQSEYSANHPLQHIQKDMKLALNLAEQVQQPLHVTAAANEMFKHAKRSGFSEHDSCAIYIKTRL